FVCTKYGVKKTSTATNPRPTLKCDCKAWLHVKRSDVGRNLSSANKRNDDTLYSVVQVSKLYTHAIFKKFQDEILGSSGFYPVQESEYENIRIFKIWDFKKQEAFSVSWDCIVQILYNLGVLNIPSKYILKRWCKSETFNQRRASSGHVQSKEERYKNICLLIEKIKNEASFCDESYDHAYPKLEKVLEKCVSINKSQ
ncbi:Protein FAR-RED ELONGATED HYPOCOTYL 3, partial [Bienertia sinuspersici]